MTSVQDIITALRNLELPETLHEFIPEAAEILAEITVGQELPAIDRRLLPLFTALRDRQITAADGEIVVRDVTGQGIAIGHGAQVITVHVHLSASEPPFQPITRDEVLTAFYQASSVLRAYPGEIAGIHLERAEVGQIVEWIRSASPKERLGMLIDQPGSGKTVIMRDVLAQLEADHTPVLAIKADLLSGIKTRDELIKSLDLPSPVEECVRQLTFERPVVILLDQLDALSLALSRDQATLDLVLSLLARLRDYEHVRIIASCRSFDLNNDPHLSKIKIDRKFQLQPLDRGQVTHILQAIGVDQAHLLPAHRTLLTTPLHLDIYAKIVADETVRGTESFRTLQELYEALWRKHIECVPPEHPTPAARIAAIYRLVDNLQDRRQLTAPVAVLDEYVEAASYLERVNFIRRERSNWLFVHETLFDYCYARRFVARNRSLSQEILSSPQGLFERSQILQVLAHLRGADPEIYRREITSLIFHRSIRYHLQQLIMRWFGSLPDPTRDELNVALRILRDTDTQTQFLQAAGSNIAWFDLLEGVILQSLFQVNSERTIDAVFRYLGTFIQQHTSQILAHLRPYAGRSEAWDAGIAFCLSRIEQWQSSEALSVLCDLLARGHSDRWVSLCMHHLSQANPAAGCLALRAYLDRRLDALLEQQQTDRQSRTENSDAGYSDNTPDRSIWERYLFGELGVSELAESAAQAATPQFVEHLLPWFVRTSVLLTEWQQDEMYPADPLFTWGWYNRRISEGPAFARWMAEALAQLARTQPVEFRALATEMIIVDSLAAQRLLVEGYLADPAMYAHDIFTYLLADKRRLTIGEMLENPHYDSCRLYGAVFPHLNETRRVALEQMIVDLRPAWEQSSPPQRGITQLRFLQSVAPGLLSEAAYRRLQELERKFPGFEQRPPQGIRTGSVGSPIEETAQVKMSDEAWLGAMHKYDDSTTWGSPKEYLFKGGVIELSRAFAEQVKNDPERFYLLAQRFDENVSLRYTEAAISGLAESDAPVVWVYDLVRRFAPRIEGEYRKGVCRSLEKRADAGIPNDLLDLMTDWALHDPDPTQEMWRVSAGLGDQRYYGGDPLGHGINTVRGASLQAVTYCALTHKPPQVERAFELLEAVADDPSTAVRACVVERLAILMRHNTDRTLTIIQQTLDGYPELLRTVIIHDLLYHLYYHHFPQIRPFIEAMLSDEDDVTRQAGGRLVCLAAFQYPEATSLAEQALQGDEWLRRGAAQVYAHNLGQQDVEVTCQERLLQLMHDQDEEVRKYVGECFRQLHPEQVHRVRVFIEAFLASPALPLGARHLIDYLKPLAIDEQELALQATERLIDTLGHQIIDMQTSAALLEDDLAWLPLTVYTHADNDQMRARAMNTFEQFLLLGSWTAQEALTQWDRQ
jgi:hypothetical protein